MYNEEKNWINEDINEALVRIKREEEEYYRERELKQAQAGPKAFLGKIIHFSKSHETKIHLC